jgi:hypothetical protein
VVPLLEPPPFLRYTVQMYIDIVPMNLLAVLPFPHRRLDSIRRRRPHPLPDDYPLAYSSDFPTQSVGIHSRRRDGVVVLL